MVHGLRYQSNEKLDETLTPIPDAAPAADAKSAAESIAPQLQALADLFEQGATIGKRAILDARHGKEDIFATVSIILWELLFTVKFILIKLGLGKSPILLD